MLKFLYEIGSRPLYLILFKQRYTEETEMDILAKLCSTQ